MKTITTVVYSAAELTGMAREKALDFMRADAVELAAADIRQAAAALIEQLPGAYLIDADEIRRAAQRTGDVYAMDIAARYIDDTRMHGARAAAYVESGLNAAAGYLIRGMERNPFERFSDECLIDSADCAGFYFDENGRLMPAGV